MNTAVSYAAATARYARESAQLSEYDAETLERMIDEAYTKYRVVTESRLNEIFSSFFTMYNEGGWTYDGRAINPSHPSPKKNEPEGDQPSGSATSAPHHTGPSAMPSTNVYSELAVGCNALSLARLYKTAEAKAAPEVKLALHDAGVRHWPLIAAANGGVIKLQTRTASDREDRTYTHGAFPLQSVAKDSGLRAAFTSPYPGEVLVYADWRASHWQLLAFRSGDAQLVADLRSGDLYCSLFPGLERRAVKAGLATLLNGGGLTALQKFFDEPEAIAFRRDAMRLLETRWATANAYRLQLQSEAIANGWADAEKEYAGAGVGLMRLEAAALRAALEEVQSMGLGARVVLPMHDGVLVSAPAARAQEVAEALGYCMALASTLSDDEATNEQSTWVEVEVTPSWTGQESQLLGNALRATALALSNSEDADELSIAAAVMPSVLQDRLNGLPPRSAEARLVKQALQRNKDAAAWHRAASARGDEPRVQLPRPTANYANLCRLLREDGALPRLRFNVRTLSPETEDGERVDDNLLGPRFVEVVENRYGMQVSFDLMGRAVMDVARDTTYDPIKVYFDGLCWDGKKRLDTWMTDYTGAVAGCSSEPEKLANIYGRKWFLSVVARAFEPGCKVDSVLVLQGAQNIGKSTLFKTIAPCRSFAAVAIDPGDKDIVRRAAAYAVVEWPEAAGMSKREQEALKQYFSEQVDRLRLPYGKADIEIPRRVVFGMTANNNNFLQDPTGSRRYWPVTVEGVDLDGLRAVVDQLWAEAVYLYRAHATQDFLWWLSPEEDALREEAAADYTEEDPYYDAIMAVAKQHKGAFKKDVVLNFLDIPHAQRNQMGKVIDRSLRRAGFVSKLVRFNGKPERRWVGTVPAEPEVDPIKD